MSNLRLVEKILILTALLVSSFSVSAKKETDMTWFCISDDDPRGVYVNYPLRGAAEVQIGVADNLTMASVELEKEEGADGRDTIRFDFNDYSESFIIVTGGRKGNKMTNFFRAGYYNFSNTEEGATMQATQYLCLSAILK